MHNNIMIIAPEDVEPNRITAIDKINIYLDQEGHASLIKLNEQQFNRDKAFTFSVWGGAYKTVFGKKFINFLNSLEWYLPEETVVIFSQDSTVNEDYLGIWKPLTKSILEKFLDE